MQPLPVVPPVSAVMITLNAERLLRPVLSALAWCNEIVLIDSGSTDQTVAIATEFGCRIFQRTFDGYGNQKNFAVEQARNNWVFVVDADEIVTPELSLEIKQTLTASGPVVGYQVPFTLLFLGRIMRGGEYKRPKLCLFDKRAGNYNSNLVHETPMLTGPIGRLQNHMLHDSYGSLQEYIDKLNQYTTAGALDKLQAGQQESIWPVLYRFPHVFLKEYLFRRNFLNGYPGFVWSFFSGVYPVLKYAKLRELWRVKAE